MNEPDAAKGFGPLSCRRRIICKRCRNSSEFRLIEPLIGRELLEDRLEGVGVLVRLSQARNGRRNTVLIYGLCSRGFLLA